MFRRNTDENRGEALQRHPYSYSTRSPKHVVHQACPLQAGNALHTHIPALALHIMYNPWSRHAARTKPSKTSCSLLPHNNACVIIAGYCSSHHTCLSPSSCHTPARPSPDSRRSARKRTRAACACAAPGVLCGSLSGIAPSYCLHISIAGPNDM